MAHGITEDDMMFSGNGIRPWHGLGTVIDGVASSDEAIRLANLGWEVVQSPVCLPDGTEIENVFANVRSDTGKALGIVRGKYQIVQNKDAFAFVDGIFKNAKGIECKYETAGSLFGGRRVFMLVRLPETDLVGDKVENYLFLTTSHDGSTGVTAGITNVRVVCNNTLQMAERGAQRLWRIRHTQSLKGRQQEAETALGLALNYQQRVQEDALKMASQKIREELFFKELFKKMNFSEKRAEEVGLAVADLYKNKDDLQNFRGTAWGMYNAVADYVSNARPGRVTAKTQDRRMAKFMDGFKLLTRAQEVLQAVA